MKLLFWCVLFLISPCVRFFYGCCNMNLSYRPHPCKPPVAITKLNATTLRMRFSSPTKTISAIPIALLQPTCFRFWTTIARPCGMSNVRPVVNFWATPMRRMRNSTGSGMEPPVRALETVCGWKINTFRNEKPFVLSRKERDGPIVEAGYGKRSASCCEHGSF
jgi:hypothetical protein